ncbi:MAG: hypothetical protein ACI9H8_000315 [Lysobacterales bacterium]|jgi:hypothetical protein
MPGCLEGPMEQFGRHLGQWKIEDSEYQKEDGSWKDGVGAQWDFVCLGNGAAIQDFWMPNDGGTGTNLLTWNKETESWDIAWTITGLSGFAHIGAQEADDGSIVMSYKSPIPTPPRRITFFPPETNSWNWKLEISLDEGENWVEVYRIKATRLFERLHNPLLHHHQHTVKITTDFLTGIFGSASGMYIAMMKRELFKEQIPSQHTITIV